MSETHTPGPDPIDRNWLDRQTIKVQAATIVDLLAALEQFCNDIDRCGHANPMPLLCRFCQGRTAIQKAKESR